MFELQTFPARDGDCLILTWGPKETPKRMMIDGGRQGCWPSVKAAILALPEAERVFELLVVTHIDADHIAGVLKMLADPHRPVRFKEIWFNAYKHLREFLGYETFGAAQGDKLSGLLDAAPLIWNRRFAHRAVVVSNPAAPPRLNIEGLEILLISPTPEKLRALEPEWRSWIEREQLRLGEEVGDEPAGPLEFAPGYEVFGKMPDVASLAAESLPRDGEPPNGSSIAFIARHGERGILLTGDAHADVVETALSHLTPGERTFDLVKLSHHGSRGNLSAGLCDAWICRNFLVSTDGTRHHHPDPQTLARLITADAEPKSFYFNHSHAQAIAWDNEALRQSYNYRTHYPTEPGRLRIDIDHLPRPAEAAPPG